MLVIALTGGIGSGKTTVSEIFKSKNIPVIDTDIIARQIVEKGKSAYAEVIKTFGSEILNKDQTINRQQLRELIFSCSEKRTQLENILHPIIWSEVQSQLTFLTTSESAIPPYCIVVVPLLIENLSRLTPVTFDRILVIDTPEELQLERAKKRDNSSESNIKSIMQTQVTRQARIDAADDIVYNLEDINSLKTQVENLHKQYIAKGSKHSI